MWRTSKDIQFLVTFAIFVWSVSWKLLAFVVVQSAMHNNFMQIFYVFGTTFLVFASAAALECVGPWKYPWFDRNFGFHLVTFIIIIIVVSLENNVFQLSHWANACSTGLIKTLHFGNWFFKLSTITLEQCSEEFLLKIF